MGCTLLVRRTELISVAVADLTMQEICSLVDDLEAEFDPLAAGEHVAVRSSAELVGVFAPGAVLFVPEDAVAKLPDGPPLTSHRRGHKRQAKPKKAV